MAIDTETKRKSAIGVGKYGWRLLPKPDGTIGAEDRRHAVGHYSRTSAVGIVYTLVGNPQLFEEAEYEGTISIYFEAYLRAFVGTANARLRNVTDDTVVSGSEISTALTDKTRVRSSAITLVDGKEYQAEGGIASGDAMDIQGSQFIPLQP